LNHILEASQVGALIDEVSIPIHTAVYRLKTQSAERHSAYRLEGRRGTQNALRHALTDGEDFELLFTAPVKDAARIVNDKRFISLPVSIIGFIQRQKGLYLCDGAGKINRAAPEGYAHF